MARLTVAAVTGSRADWGLLSPVLQAIRAEPEFELKLVVTGAHLDPAFGLTVEDITGAGFPVAARVPASGAGDDGRAVGRATGQGLAGFAEVLPSLSADLLLLLGDRYEILAAATAALFARLPLAHLCGGDVTEGAFDEAIRHAVTKMAHLHFVTNADAARRVRQLGEDPASVHLVGSPALDRLRTFEAVPREAFLAEVGLPVRQHLVLVSFHPVTLDAVPSIVQLEELLAVLDDIGDEHAILLTGANADTEGRGLNERLRAFAAARPGRSFRQSLGHELYFSALSHAAVLIGNSSSGLYEAPSFRLPTVNIGDRQKGRLRAASVVDCAPRRDAIAAALQRARRLDCTDVVNPYGDGRATERIMDVLRTLDDPKRLLKKRFFDLECA